MGDQWFTAVEATAVRPARVDTTTANPARVYDYWLGGKDNFAVDRKAAHDAIAVNPGIIVEVRTNRAFLSRAVRHLAGPAGIRQFLDIGAGMPTADNTHDVAQRAAADSRVLYVDNDPMVVAHARARLMDAVPSGSYLVISHPASDISAQSMADMAELLTRTGPPMTARSYTDVSRFFNGLDLLTPGVVALSDWRPEATDVRPAVAPGWCGGARKP